MTVVYAADRNLYPVLPTVINSLLINNPNAKVYVFAEDDEITNLTHSSVTVINYNIFKDYLLPSSPQAKGYYIAYPTFIRLWIADVLKEDKVLYLDVDTLVDQDLTDLWNTNLTNYVIAGVKDYNWSTFQQQYTNIYINAGVLLFNLKKWRELDFTKQATNLLNTYKFTYGDQDIINKLCHNKKLILDARYNYGRYSDYKNATHPYCIYHWMGKPKAWDKDVDKQGKLLWAKYYTPYLKNENKNDIINIENE